MTGELAGKIVLQNMNPDRHRSNFELAISGDENILRQKLKKQYDQAFLELTADMGMKFDPATGMATVRPRIAAKAGMGPYTFKVQADSPTHFSSTLDLKPIEGSFDLAGRKFKYASKLSLKVDITLHPTPKNVPKVEWRRDAEQVSILEAAGIIAASILIIIFGPKFTVPGKGGPLPEGAPASSIPFLHYIDPNDPRLKA